jgi:hypothetical protein
MQRAALLLVENCEKFRDIECELWNTGVAQRVAMAAYR